MEALLEIVAAEGPMRASRAYALYNRASGGKKLTTDRARAAVERALLARAGAQARAHPHATRSRGRTTTSCGMPDTPARARARARPRTLEEVPLDEIAELMRRLRATRRPSDLKRAVLDSYGLVRLTQRADEYLGLALGLL